MLSTSLHHIADLSVPNWKHLIISTLQNIYLYVLSRFFHGIEKSKIGCFLIEVMVIVCYFGADIDVLFFLGVLLIKIFAGEGEESF